MEFDRLLKEQGYLDDGFVAFAAELEADLEVWSVFKVDPQQVEKAPLAKRSKGEGG